MAVSWGSCFGNWRKLCYPGDISQYRRVGPKQAPASLQTREGLIPYVPVCPPNNS